MGRHKTGPCDASVTCRTWIPYNGFVLSSYPSLMGYKEYLRISISTKYYFLRYSPIFFISAPCAVGGSPLFKFRKLIITFQPSLPHYFMRFSAILCKAIFVIGRLLPRRGGVEVTGQTASLLAKAAPSLQHHSSIGSWSLAMTIFHCFLFLQVPHADKYFITKSAARRGRSWLAS